VPLNPSLVNQTPSPCLPGFEQVTRYWDRSRELIAAKILPGEFYVTTQNEIIVTVLGSCVSACIRDPIFGIGGMNHFMLPLQGHDTSSWEEKGLGLATRYGNYAMEHLVNEILKNGGMRKNLEVKVFGGGKIISQMTNIGDKNIRFVLDYIKTEGLKLLSQDLGDLYPRKVQYHPQSGKVRIKKLRSLHNDTISAREREYMQEISRSKQEGEIDLF
jgi:chemotaxis protein CheD